MSTATPSSEYSATVKYSPGSIVTFQGVPYIMVEGAGSPGYPPLRAGDNLWKVFKGVYEPAVTYKVGEAIIQNKKLYWMREGAGAPGYAPDRVGDKLWVNVNYTFAGGARSTRGRKAFRKAKKSRKMRR
jgi:hypothetical protein